MRRVDAQAQRCDACVPDSDPLHSLAHTLALELPLPALTRPARPCSLRDDHRRARRLGAVLSALPYVGAVAPVDTNIAIFTLAQGWDAKVGHTGWDRRNGVAAEGKLRVGPVCGLVVG